MDFDETEFESENVFYPEAFFIGANAWHKFIAAVAERFCSDDPEEAAHLVIYLLWELACSIHVEINFVSNDGELGSLLFSPSRIWSHNGACFDALMWLASAEDFSIQLNFGGDAEEVRFREAPKRDSHIEDNEKSANDALSTRIAIRWLRALGLIGPESTGRYWITNTPDERRWKEANGELNGGDVVQLFADVLRKKRDDVALRILGITHDEPTGFYKPRTASDRAKNFLERQRQRYGPRSDDHRDTHDKTDGVK